MTEPRTDDELLAHAVSSDAADAARRVFDNSARLGRSFTRYHGGPIPQAELRAALARLATPAVPCLAHAWVEVEGEAGLRLERDGCPSRALGPAACDWWRDAVAGLVEGITDGLRHARHASCGHGDARCVDVIYRDPESSLRFGPLPSDLVDALAAVTRTIAIFDPTLVVTFLGVSERVLYYQLVASGCGTSNVRAQPMIEQAVHRRHPELVVREVSPRPVLDEQTPAA